MTREEIILAARKWIGTPYHHAARMHGVGVDCVQLLIAVGLACGMSEEQMPDYFDYSREPDGAILPRECGSRLVLKDPPWLPGDVLAFWFIRPDRPQHAAIVSYDSKIIHVRSKHPDKVVEVSLDGIWLHRIWGVYAYPGVED